MISVDASGRVRLSSQLTKSAGFRAGQKVAVVANGKNGFTVTSAARVPKNTDNAKCSVEQDGRMRVATSILAELGVKASKRSNLNASSAKGSITVSI